MITAKACVGGALGPLELDVLQSRLEADDLDGDPVFLAKSAFDLRYTGERAPAINFADIKDVRKN